MSIQPHPLSKEWMKDLDDMSPPLLFEEGNYQDHDIHLIVNTKVDAIHPEDQTITTHRNERISYDHLTTVCKIFCVNAIP